MDSKSQKELLVIKIMNSGFRAKDIKTGEILSLKITGTFKIRELDTIVFEIDKEWVFNKQKYASGKVLSNQFIPSNIKTEKLLYRDDGIWDPHDSFGDEADEYFADYIKEGYRMSYEFENYTGYGFYKEEEDPVFDAAELHQSGDWRGAYDKLTKLWEDFPQCIDALVHIGLLYFDRDVFIEHAYNCYNAAVLIAEQGIPHDFDGIFLWEILENRPYLRALQGLCLILWKKKEFDKSHEIAKKLLRICPTDNLGVRLIIDKIRNREEWREE
jgi:tetratricopeptide (TPR) repeat protein